MKAIQTVYKDYKFRSRLEARWAVFFDAANIKWEYEPEGFDLGEHGLYLPDFYLPEFNKWVEVKAKELNDSEAEKALALSSFTNSSVLCLTQIPDPDIGEYSNSLIGVSEYIGCESSANENNYFSRSLIEFYLDNACGNVEGLQSSETLMRDAILWDMDYYMQKHGKKHPLRFKNGIKITVEHFSIENLSFCLRKARQARFEHGETPL